MKTLFTTIAILYSLNSALAQTGQVHIEQDKKIEELLKLYKSANSSSEYYRIQVGFGSHAKAQRIKSEVEVDFPDLSSKIDFDSPTYRVRVGRFKNKLDAERKFIEVRAKYPDAMLLKPKKSSK
ncbi:SPOR domain-containing protein [Aurantibacter crassamenti]|uniref:SPOR domain-containing protein n=1 Tax=Aurantibacter crassamenti TaxID=1837375 RepID=UPI001939EF58|nr:SPOR domain-containing protein [Aurantibacter crassamenti]MBM1105961.1 SPOR domain-containing protein [Aurantibacter crassamenti]